MSRSARRPKALLVILLATIGVVIAGVFVTGRVSYVTTSGVSMLPLYHQGDLVVVAKSDSYHIGEIVAYEVPATHLVILHRIIGKQGAGFVMKGDNNESIDPTHPTVNQVIGHAVFLVPDGGIWIKRLESPLSLAFIAVLLLSGGGTAVHSTRRRKKGSTPQHASLGREGDMAMPLATAAPWLRSAVAATAVVVIAGAVLGALVWSGPESKRVARAPVSLSTTFSYTASVRSSPAYDGTTVTSPQPVFRNLANMVDVHFAYKGVAGTMDVLAELSTPSGWQSTVVLGVPQKFQSSTYDGNVALNLDSLEARAQAAAAVTGLAPEPLTVAVVARLSGADGVRFSPTLQLSLSPLQLTLVGNPTALTVKGSAASGATTRAPRTIGALGRHVTVATARLLAVILLLGGLLSAAALALIARLTATTSEGAGIRRRYASLLVAVEPMPTPPGHSVVSVREFATLSRLAEHYGSLMLHWSREGVDTFVVQAQGIIYRYRAGGGDPLEPVASDGPLERSETPIELAALTERT